MKENAMKKTLSFILAALFLASAVVSCDKGNTVSNETKDSTAAVETTASTVNIPETTVPSADSPETETPSPAYPPQLIVENGEAMAHIVLEESVSQLEQYAAEELAYHIKTVSNAEIPITNTVQDGSLPIIICTPDTCPELAELFPEDLKWLTALRDENGRYWADDGFSIRFYEGTLYIFGATPRGALNGVYDFIEDNMGVLWVRAEEEIGLIYEEMPTVAIETAHYTEGHREKSPFQLRGTSFGGKSDEDTQILYARNKLNTVSGADKFKKENGVWEVDRIWITEHDNFGHCLKFWVRNSPLYDPDCTEYWNVDEFGSPAPNEINQINFWSEKTLETVTAAILELLSQHPDIKTVPIGIEDGLLEKMHCYNPPYSEQPFEYAEGQFVDPGDSSFHSTVVFTFINNVAKRVAESYPNVKIMAYAYHNAIIPPLCEIEPNVMPVFTPIEGCMTDPITDPDNPHNAIVKNLIEEWSLFPNELGVCEYYFCSSARSRYERPIWYKMQSDMQFYAENGFRHFVALGQSDRIHSGVWSMNTLSNWLYAKLLWNPNEDVDALIRYFCDKVYGSASEHMQEYYRLLTKGWNEGEGDMILWNYKITADFYLDTFVYTVDLEDDIKAALRNAYAAADNYVIEEHIYYILETYEQTFPDEE